jgi:hypothetical protein
VLPVFSSRQELVAALGTYADRRLSGPLDERLVSSPWELQVTALSRFYSWAVSEGLTSAVPFTQAVGMRMVDGRLVQGERNLARLRRPKPHMKIQHLEGDFAELFCHGLAGLGPGGLEDEGFRGRFPGRNEAMGGLVLGTGMRRREFSHLLVHEVPPLPAEPTEVPIPWAVPELAAKGRKFRTTWIDYCCDRVGSPGWVGSSRRFQRSHSDRSPVSEPPGSVPATRSDSSPGEPPWTSCSSLACGSTDPHGTTSCPNSPRSATIPCR